MKTIADYVQFALHGGEDTSLESIEKRTDKAMRELAEGLKDECAARADDGFINADTPEAEQSCTKIAQAIRNLKIE